LQLANSVLDGVILSCGIQLLENMILISFGIGNAGVASDPMNIVNIVYNNLAKELDGDSIRVHR
jgi:hypothetical protein